MNYCCSAFQQKATNLDAPAGGGMMYPRELRPQAQFELDPDGKTWNINGCCGGGCYVVTQMRFCPFCGSELADPAAATTEEGAPCTAPSPRSPPLPAVSD